MMSSAPMFIAPDHSSQAPSDGVAAPSFDEAAGGALIFRKILQDYGDEILKAYGKEILECASEQFLDLALEMRLQTISLRDLVMQLARANRLGYEDDDVLELDDNIEDGKGAPLVQGGNAHSRSKPDASGSSNAPRATASQRGLCSPTSSRPLSLEEARVPNHANLAQDERLPANTPHKAHWAAPSKQGVSSIQSLQGGAGIHEVPKPAGTATKQEQTMTGSGSRVVADAAKSGNDLKRGLTIDATGEVQNQRAPRKLLRGSAGSLSPSIVVISDSEPESDEEDDL